jgi:hypothetical protein
MNQINSISHIWEDNIKRYFKQKGTGVGNQMHLAQKRGQWWAVSEHVNARIFKSSGM